MIRLNPFLGLSSSWRDIVHSIHQSTDTLLDITTDPAIERWAGTSCQSFSSLMFRMA